MFLSWNCTWLETSDWNCFSRNSAKRSRKVTKTNLDDDNVQIFSEYFYFDIRESCLFLPFVLSLAVPDDWNMFFFSLFIFRLLSLKKQRKLRLMFSPVYTEVFYRYKQSLSCFSGCFKWLPIFCSEHLNRFTILNINVKCVYVLF